MWSVYVPEVPTYIHIINFQTNSSKYQPHKVYHLPGASHITSQQSNHFPRIPPTKSRAMADDQASKDAASKARIIKHMNGDHQRELSHYLRHYCSLSASKARKPLLRDLDFNSMTIQTTDGAAHIVPISPPMSSWADARIRAVDMDRTARASLGISHLVVNEYQPPKLLLVPMIEVIMLMFFGMAFQSMIVPGTFVYEFLQKWYPGGASWALWVMNAVGGPILVIHVIEAFWMMTKLKRFGVETGSSLWYKWVGNNLAEGITTHFRFDAIVRTLEKEAEKKTH